MYQFQSDIYNVIVCAVWKILKIISSTWWTIWTALYCICTYQDLQHRHQNTARSACTVIWWNYALQIWLCSTNTLSSLFSASGPFFLQNSTKVAVFWCLCWRSWYVHIQYKAVHIVHHVLLIIFKIFQTAQRHYLYAFNVTNHPSRHVIILHATCTCSCQVVSMVYDIHVNW
jgi:hypothetical protein